MYRGTTPRITFKFKNEINLEAFDQIWVTFKASGGFNPVEIDFEIDDVHIDQENQQLYVDLTQEQTLLLKDKNKLQTQIRFFIDADPPQAYTTNIVDLTVNGILRDGVIS